MTPPSPLLNQPYTQSDWLSFRQQFPALAFKTYFNYGGQGPMPRSAMDAITQAQEHIQRIGPFSNAVNSWIREEAHETRVTIAHELNVPHDTITLTENVTEGCNIALWGIDWQPGDHILLSDCEHPGIIAAVQELQRRFQLEVSTFSLLATLAGGDPIEAMAKALQDNTRLVVLSHILWNTGQVLPLDEMVTLCHRRGVLVLVDAAQSVGMIPLNLVETKVDFYAFTGHKWWCGAAGLGGLYVRLGAPLHPTFIGWRGIQGDAAGAPTGWKVDGQRFEVATSNYSLFAGLRAAIATHHQWGTSADRYQRICHLSRYLWTQLGDRPYIARLCPQPPASGLVSFQFTGVKDVSTHHTALVQWLEAQQHFVRLLLSPHCVRACLHYFTLESELDQLVHHLDAYRETLGS